MIDEESNTINNNVSFKIKNYKNNWTHKSSRQGDRIIW